MYGFSRQKGSVQIRNLETEKETETGAERDKDAQLSPRGLGSWLVLGAQHPRPDRDAGQLWGGGRRASFQKSRLG